MLKKTHQKTKPQKQPKKKHQKKTLQGLAYVNILLKSCVKVQWPKPLKAIKYAQGQWWIKLNDVIVTSIHSN